MPDTGKGTRSDFAHYQRELGSWLHANVCDVRALGPDEIKGYDWKHVVAGWRIRLPESERCLKVLLNDSFPYSSIQIAYDGDDRYLHWPHVEEANFLCLPDDQYLPCENLAYSIQGRLTNADNLIDNCQSEGYVVSESQSEFLTYWGRQDGALPAISQIDVENTKPRKIAARLCEGRYIVGEDDDQVLSWLTNSKKDSFSSPVQALFAFIEDSPALPLPKSGRQFIGRQLNQAANLDGLLHGISPFEPTIVILASHGDSGAALFGAKLHAQRRDGFRATTDPKMVRRIWSSVSSYAPIRGQRADSGWIHGRDQDRAGHRTLSGSNVVLVGAGSLGSQVACRLAQAGVGRLIIIDPESLEPSNVGRHALGIESINKSKAHSLADLLSIKYPHGNFKGWVGRWQDVFRDQPRIFEEADLVVSCTGEITDDLAWDAMHQSGKTGDAPTLYGWLGTQGSTGHALALRSGGPAFSCVFDLDGVIKLPDTEFEEGDQRRAEPACGTEFQPYGPLATGQVELLVSRTAIDILMGKALLPHHRVCACSTQDLEEIGGRWTAHHNTHRPNGYDGPFEYLSTVARCNNCHNCR